MVGIASIRYTFLGLDHPSYISIYTSVLRRHDDDSTEYILDASKVSPRHVFWLFQAPRFSAEGFYGLQSGFKLE